MIITNDSEHVHLNMDEVYEWRLRFSKNPLYGFDDTVAFNLNVSSLVKVLVFLMEHLRHEVIEVEVKTPNGIESEGMVAHEVLVYVNGLSEVLETTRGNREVSY